MREMRLDDTHLGDALRYTELNPVRASPSTTLDRSLEPFRADRLMIEHVAQVNK